MNNIFDILKTVGGTATAKAGAVPSREPTKLRPGLIRLRFEIERTQCTINAVRNHFKQAVGLTLINYYIYKLNAAQLRYQFLLRKFKSQGD